jgi:hypothetical protein
MVDDSETMTHTDDPLSRVIEAELSEVRYRICSKVRQGRERDVGLPRLPDGSLLESNFTEEKSPIGAYIAHNVDQSVHVQLADTSLPMLALDDPRLFDPESRQLHHDIDLVFAASTPHF